MAVNRRWVRTLVASSALVAVAGCGGRSASRSGAVARPSTQAKLLILSPTPNEVTGPEITAMFQVQGGTVLPPAQATGPLRGDQGHIHVSLDGKLVQMAYATQARLDNLAPGSHAISAEWVASDHLPFANRVVADVLFSVRSP